MTDSEIIQAATNAVTSQQKLVGDLETSMMCLRVLADKGHIDVSNTLKTANTLLHELLDTRAATMRETAAILKALCELQHGFMGSRFKDTVIHLSEFVGLCERLKALKESGFLDSVFKAVPPEGKL